MATELLNLDECTAETHLYRIFELQRLLQLFANGENVLVRPRLWDDPFENSILGLQRADTRLSLYGQCWTLLPESDAMWRIYSPHRTGVRVDTTIRQLASVCTEPYGEGPAGLFFIGRVKYMTVEQMSVVSFEQISPSNRARFEVSTLLVKRIEFEHEAEVRLIYRSEEESPEDDIYRFPAKPGNFVNSLQLDPRLSPELVDVYTHYFTSRLGFTGSVSQSTLYRAPRDARCMNGRVDR